MVWAEVPARQYTAGFLQLAKHVLNAQNPWAGVVSVPLHGHRMLALSTMFKPLATGDWVSLGTCA